MNPLVAHEPEPELVSTRFRRALSASGLIDGLVLHRIASEVLAARPQNAEQQDRLFADRLVEQGRLNRWQVSQLEAGRTKFTLGSYRILDSIGRGGMGHVFLAEHELLGRPEAIKVLPRNKMTSEAVAAFRHEVRAQAKLDHPNLVRVSYADRDGDTYFFVTEYVPGVDLRRLIRRRGALAESLAAFVIAQVAEALDYAHQHGLVHRDVKPGNLLITPVGRVKVTDLGLAWFLDEENTNGSPHDGTKVVGTPDYLAPEAIRQPGRILPISDVYALGCTFFYAVTGKVPFPGGNHLDKLERHVHRAPPDPRRFNPHLSSETALLISAMLAKEPELRIPSARLVAEALEPLHASASIEQLTNLVESTAEEIQRGRQQGGSDPESDPSVNDSADPLASLPETVGLTGQAESPPAADQESTHPTKQTMPPKKGSLDRFLRACTVAACVATVLLLLLASWRQLFE